MKPCTDGVYLQSKMTVAATFDGHGMGGGNKTAYYIIIFLVQW